MGIGYGRSTIRMYTEVLLRMLLRELSRAQESSAQNNNSSVFILLNNTRQDKNIIEFDSQEKRLILNQVSNEGLSRFLNNNINEITNSDLISCCCQSYMFSEPPRNTPENKARRARNSIDRILSNEYINNRYRFYWAQIGNIFTELNNAQIAKRKTTQFYSSAIDVDLENLTEDAIQKYIQEICAAGGRLDRYRYLSSEHQRSRRDLNPRLLLMMKSWVQLIFDCDIENWNNTHWEMFEKEWSINYGYPPNREYINNILINSYDAGTFNQQLCIDLYIFLKNLNKERLEHKKRLELQIETFNFPEPCSDCSLYQLIN